ncbi:MAG: bL21 family ribosomal protein, partial [Clostridia bacterium]|nr:bL21 family ribosomal protein [Clostridia bacterium]
MYAIANISGKQFKVEVGSTIVVDRLNAEVG